MNMLDLEVLAIAVLTACACTIPGIFLVLRGAALMSDAISHAVLLGIVLMFLIVQNLHSPLLLVGATTTGMLTVLFTEWLIATHCLKKDAAIGLIYPLFFSIGVLLISCYARNAHLDLDMIFLGDLAYAPFYRISYAGIDCGPVALITMGAILVVNVLFVFLFYKELKIGIFDPINAHVMRMHPNAIYYGLMLLSSITAVGAFDVIGAIVVVALMITPPATALIFSNKLTHCIGISIATSLLSCFSGYTVAAAANVSIAGSIAAISGFWFVIGLVVSPKLGIFSRFMQQRAQRTHILQQIVLNTIQENNPTTISFLQNKLGWQSKKIIKIIHLLEKQKQCSVSNNKVWLQ